MVAQVAGLVHAAPKALDLLNVVDGEDFVLRTALLLEEEGHEDGPLGVGVDAAACVAARKGREEEGGALGGFEAGRRAEIGALEAL